jgi:hypothetical protein
MVACRSCSQNRDATQVSHSATGGRVLTTGHVDVSQWSIYRIPIVGAQLIFFSFLNRTVSDTVIKFQGLTVAQVSQNQAAVISDPQNHIFVLKNTGFVAYGIAGSYDVLAIVDQTHLPQAIKDHVTGSVLGRSLEVRMSSNSNSANSTAESYVVALL